MIHEAVILTCDHKNEKGEPACAAFWPHAVKTTQPDGSVGVAMLGVTQRQLESGQIFSIKTRADGLPSNTYCHLHSPADATTAKPPQAPAREPRTAHAQPPNIRRPPSPAQTKPVTQERPRLGNRMNRLKR